MSRDHYTDGQLICGRLDDLEVQLTRIADALAPPAPNVDMCLINDEQPDFTTDAVGALVWQLRKHASEARPMLAHDWNEAADTIERLNEQLRSGPWPKDWKRP